MLFAVAIDNQMTLNRIKSKSTNKIKVWQGSNFSLQRCMMIDGVEVVVAKSNSIWRRAYKVSLLTKWSGVAESFGLSQRRPGGMTYLFAFNGI